MAKAKDEPVAEPVTETITYVPGDGDPVTTKWAGQTFHANVPKEIVGLADGTPQQKLNLMIIERAREASQKNFRCASVKAERLTPALPRTAAEYRAYMIGWLGQKYESADALIARFAQDKALQVACEVGTDDYAYLGGLFMPKLHELSKAQELTQGQVAHLWVQHGFNTLPW